MKKSISKATLVAVALTLTSVAQAKLSTKTNIPYQGTEISYGDFRNMLDEIVHNDRNTIKQQMKEYFIMTSDLPCKLELAVHEDVIWTIMDDERQQEYVDERVQKLKKKCKK